MDNLKLKVFDFLHKQHQLQIPSMGLHPDLLNPLESDKSNDMEIKVDVNLENDVYADEQILESIESVYFQIDDSFDPCRHELIKISHRPNCKQIEKFNYQFNQQQYVVSKKVLQLILQKQNTCNQQFKEALCIHDEMYHLITTCKLGRLNLHSATIKYTIASLGILANYKRRKIIERLMCSFKSIKTLRRTEDLLQDLLHNGNFPGAISLILDCRSVAETYKHFYCIAALSRKLQDTLEQVEETLDSNLTKICEHFDEQVYSSIQEAYQLLGKTQMAVDQLHMHYAVTIHNTAFDTVHSYVGGDIKRQFKQLCESISNENFITCLIDLSKTLWKIIHSYYRVFNWHETCANYLIEKDEKSNKNIFNKQYVQQKLGSGILKTWHDIEIKISTYLTSTNVTCFKFEQFVRILSIINRLMQASEEFCGKKLDILQQSMKKQCLIYFAHYHASRLDELCIFLEHDGWELCPVKSTFSATQLHEFKSLKPFLDRSELLNMTDVPIIKKNSICDNIGKSRKFPESDITFSDVEFDETKDEDILATMNERTFEYISEDSEDDINHDPTINVTTQRIQIRNSRKKFKTKLIAPMVTNTTLNILRVCGRYLQMSKLLTSIAVTVIQSMIQFFELYFYYINLFFTSDLQIISESLYSTKLQLTLSRIETNLIGDGTEHMGRESLLNVRKLNLSCVVDLENDDKLFGLAERVVGVESLIFLGQQYDNLQPYLRQLVIEDAENKFLEQFYLQTVNSAIDLRKPVYMAVVSKYFNVANVLALMSRVNWEVKDVMSQHSNYVDILHHEIESFAKSLDNLTCLIPMSTDVRYALWENVAYLITHTLVEGYSNAKKCSNGGRGLMQLDYTQLKCKFEVITELRPMPYSEFVESYVKAYYIPESSLQEWIKSHKEYSSKQLIGLVSCMCQNNKKSRQKFIAIVEEQLNR